MQVFFSPSAGQRPRSLGKLASPISRFGHGFEGPSISVLIAGVLLWLALNSY